MWKYLNCGCFYCLHKYTYEGLYDTVKINVFSNPKYNSNSSGQYLNEMVTKRHKIKKSLLLDVTFFSEHHIITNVRNFSNDPIIGTRIHHHNKAKHQKETGNVS